MRIRPKTKRRLREFWEGTKKEAKILGEATVHTGRVINRGAEPMAENITGAFSVHPHQRMGEVMGISKERREYPRIRRLIKSRGYKQDRLDIDLSPSKRLRRRRIDWNNLGMDF